MGLPTYLIDNHVKTSPKYFINAGVGIGNDQKMSPESIYIKDKFKDIKIYGFEPAKNRYDIIKKDFPGYLYNVALGNTNQPITMYNDPCGSGIDMVIGFKIGEDKGCKIKCTTLDSFCNEHHMKDNILLWCDCEGFELKILKGSEGLLKSGAISYILLELWNNKPYDGDRATAVEVIKYLGQFHYEMVEKSRGNKYDAIFKRNYNEQ